MAKTVIVCEAQVPFVSGGAEFHVRELLRHLRAHGHTAELVSLPFRWSPKREMFAHAAAWRLIDLSECNNKPVDAVIATRFPTYFVRHPNKIAWLIHQYRAAYELAGTSYSDFAHVEEDVAVRAELVRLDTAMLSECTRRYANAGNTAARAGRYNGVSFEALYHPPRLADRLHAGPAGAYVLAVSRLESVKRLDLAIRAMAHAPASLSLQVAGTGSQRAELDALVSSLGLGQRVRLLGEVSDDAIIDLYAGALGVIFPPYDEDFGYVTLEAFLARKPVITTTDAGGPTEFVEDGVNGWVVPPEPAAIGEAIGRLEGDRSRAQRQGEAGYERARLITWTGVIETLVG